MGDIMNTNQKIAAAIAAVLNVHVATAYAQQTPNSSTANATTSLEEVVVTAQHREENVQDVPISMQVLTGETLRQLSIDNFDDAVKYLPNVWAAGTGPGQTNIYMRGLSVGPTIIQGNGSIGDFPNVAVYLDEQSVQVPGRNLDVYAADLERIEVLEGPQGTLFGAGAEAGVVRYITNKPKLNVFEATVDAGYATTAHGDNSGKTNGAINLPLVDDVLAIRLTGYNDTRGGYINNVPGTFVRQSTDAGIHYAGYINNHVGPPTPLNSVNNASLVGNAINPVTYTGARIGALWKINEDWNVLLTQSYQDMDAQGVFYETPQSSGSSPVTLPDLSVQLYNPSFDKDRFENTALTVNGRIGDLSVVYSGAYLVRNVVQSQDYTNYARGVYTDYYQCLSPAETGKPGQCYSPSTTWRETERDVHQSHEARLSTPDNWRLRWTAGLFWESQALYDQIDWDIRTAPGFTDLGPPPGVFSNNPSIRSENDAFFNDAKRGYTQSAAFASFDFDIIPKQLIVTAGTRYYRFNNFEYGSTESSFGCYNAGPPPCLAGLHNLSAEHLEDTNSGDRSRANLTWKVTPDDLLYYTWSQGFRPGGFNRTSHYNPTLNFRSPYSFAPDTLINNEFGWKTEWFDHHFQLNGAIYQENWNHVQNIYLDPQAALGNVVFELNGPNYRVRGAELQFVERMTTGLTLNGAASWNSSSQLNSPYLTQVNGAPVLSIPNPFGAPGSSLAQSPPFEGNMRARYEFAIREYHPFVQLGVVHQGSSHTATGFRQIFELPPFTTYDAFVGVAADSWTIQLYCENLTDTRAVLNENDNQQITAITPNRPRTTGVEWSYKFAGK
jgi:iron complex outermembrane recepter protein